MPPSPCHSAVFSTRPAAGICGCGGGLVLQQPTPLPGLPRAAAAAESRWQRRALAAQAQRADFRRGMQPGSSMPHRAQGKPSDAVRMLALYSLHAALIRHWWFSMHLLKLESRRSCPLLHLYDCRVQRRRRTSGSRRRATPQPSSQPQARAVAGSGRLGPPACWPCLVAELLDLLALAVPEIYSPHSVVAAAGRPKPINPMTVVGYLADAGGSGGCWQGRRWLLRPPHLRTFSCRCSQCPLFSAHAFLPLCSACRPAAGLGAGGA